MNLLLCILLSVSAFHPQDVRLTDSRWQDNVRRDSAWMCSLTTQQLLHSFRTTAGVFSAYEGGYDAFTHLCGWESLDCDLRGHTVGHLLTAYAYAYASTGHDIYRRKADSLVLGIRECQRAIGTGYVSAFPQGLIDRNIAGKSVWAPWYTLHKLMAGLRTQADICHNDTAYAILRDFTTWAVRKLQNVPDRPRMLRNEFGGIAEPIPELRPYFYDANRLDPLYNGNFDMGTQHCNTFLPKVLVEALKSDSGRHMAERFFHELIEHHCYASGSLSDKEHFFNPNDLHNHLSGYTGESCCTYNLMRLAREIYTHLPDDPTYMDYYERALVNHILGQQDTVTGMTHYFLPMLNGAYKLYSTPTQSFWCCVGTGFENPMRFIESIYWHNTSPSDTLFVNLFIPSRLTWHERGLVLRQETDFPRGNRTTLIIEEASEQKLTILVRTPRWTGAKKPYRAFTKRWRAGDRITVDLPMTLQREYTPDSSRVALLYGPILLAGQLDSVANPFSDPTKHNDYYTYDFHVPDSLQYLPAPNTLKPDKRFAEFLAPNGTRLAPLYDTHHRRYVVYWNTHKNNTTQRTKQDRP